MLVIGVTGQTGAGKGTVCKMLEKYGLYHIDADKVAHSVYKKGSDVLSALSEAFGEDILNPDGTANRAKIAEKAFSSAENTEKLNSIVHPAVTQKIKAIIKEQSSLGTKGVLLDAIALFESGENRLCDFAFAVIAPEEMRLERIMVRDGIEKNAALRRIRAQKDESFYKNHADIIIKNYPPYNLDDEVKKVLLWAKL